MRKAFVFSVALLLLSVLPMVAIAGQEHPITVTIIYDNYAVEDRLETDWGFSALVETGDQTILFDAGTNGEMFLRNFRALGKDPLEIDAVRAEDDADQLRNGGAAEIAVLLDQ